MKTPHGERRPPYVLNTDHSRDPPTDREFKLMRGRSGAKLWRKARTGKL